MINMSNLLQILVILCICLFYINANIANSIDTSSFSINSNEIQSNKLSNNLIDNDMITKTGTTIIGLCCKQGIVLGADTRTTSGSLIINKLKHKIHQISSKIYCCTAGTVADCDQYIHNARYQLKRYQYANQFSKFDNLNNFNNINIVLYSLRQSIRTNYQNSHNRKPQAVFLVAGYDNNFKLASIDNNGIISQTSYCCLGSGSTKAYSILEAELCKLQINPNEIKEYYIDININIAIELVRKAILSGIYNDLGSGNNLDIVIISNEKTHELREFIHESMILPVSNNENQEDVERSDIGEEIILRKSIDDEIIIERI